MPSYACAYIHVLCTYNGHGARALPYRKVLQLQLLEIPREDSESPPSVEHPWTSAPELHLFAVSRPPHVSLFLDRIFVSRYCKAPSLVRCLCQWALLRMSNSSDPENGKFFSTGRMASRDLSQQIWTPLFLFPPVQIFWNIWPPQSKYFKNCWLFSCRQLDSRSNWEFIWRIYFKNATATWTFQELNLWRCSSQH